MNEFFSIFHLDSESVEIAIKIILSAVVGSVIGLERVLAGKDPGLRTFTLICLGSCVYTMLSEIMGAAVGSEPSRIAAQIVPGIGFLGAGAIFRASDRIAGLTTAALMWLTASIGMAIGYGYSNMALFAVLVAMIFLFIHTRIHRTLRRLRPDAYKHRKDD